MRNLVVSACLLLPVLATAAPGGERPAESALVEFTGATRDAFDHSGHRVSHYFLPGGAMLAEHHGTLGSVTVARLGADGGIETLCTTNEAAATAWMTGQPAARTESIELHLDSAAGRR